MTGSLHHLQILSVTFSHFPLSSGAKSSSPKALITTCRDNSQIIVSHSGTCYNIRLRYLMDFWTSPFGTCKPNLPFPQGSCTSWPDLSKWQPYLPRLAGAWEYSWMRLPPYAHMPSTPRADSSTPRFQPLHLVPWPLTWLILLISTSHIILTTPLVFLLPSWPMTVRPRAHQCDNTPGIMKEKQKTLLLPSTKP